MKEKENLSFSMLQTDKRKKKKGFIKRKTKGQDRKEKKMAFERWFLIE